MPEEIQQPPQRLRFQTKCNVDDDVIQKNVKKSQKYPRAQWGVLTKPPVAVCGGGLGLKRSLEELKRWPHEIYAVNDTAGYLSDNGISCKIFAIDCQRRQFKIGPLVKGALYASRVARSQYNLFPNWKQDIRVFDMLEDNPTGIEGGPTAVCRCPHLLLRMGYRAVVLFGFDSCFYNESHVDGQHDDAYSNMLIVRVNGIDFLSNAALLIQAEYLTKVCRTHPNFIINRSGGMLAAMIQNPDTWEVVAIGDDLKAQYERAGVMVWNKKYDPTENKIWRPHPTL